MLEKGTKKDILEFVASKNILNRQLFMFEDILYLLKDREFFIELTGILEQRCIYHPQVWSFAYFHLHRPAMRQHLADPESQARLKSHLKFFRNGLAEVSSFSMREYFPVVNQRTHSLQDRVNILNEQLR